MPDDQIEASIKNGEFKKRVGDLHSIEAVESVQKTIEGVDGIPEQAWIEEISPLVDRLSGAKGDINEFLKIILLIENRIKESREFWRIINNNKNN